MPRILMFHKPKGLVVTRSDERGRRTVYDAMPAWALALGFKAIGRLDKDSRGLLLFTDDGKAAEAISRPGTHAKVYEVWVRGRATPDHVRALERGVRTALGTMRAAKVELKGGSGAKSRLLVTLAEGKNRQVRRMLASLRDPATGTALKVLELKRVAYGPVALDIPSGAWRELTAQEAARLV